MTEMQTQAKAPKTEYFPVQMKDGRTVQFAGKRQSDKSYDVEEDGTVSVRIDFRSGDTVRVSTKDLSKETVLTAVGHGLSQKLGDTYASEKDPDDMFLACEAMAKQLKEEGWSAPKAVGDGFAGASIVIRAICEATGKPIDQVKAFLEKKLATAKAAVEAGNAEAKLTRAELYQSFRNPSSKTGVIIKRLEEEKLSKLSKVNSDDLLAEVETDVA